MRSMLAMLLLVAGMLGTAFAQVPEPLRAGGWPPIRASYQGRPLLVHLWSLTCAPCLAEMPEWGERIRRNPGVAFVFINTDGMRHQSAAARRLALAGVKPTRSLIYADEFTERLQYDIAPDWAGELPRTEWIRPRGPGAVLLGPVSDALFRQWVAGAH